MKILDSNNKFLLVLAQPSTLYLIDAVTLKVLNQKSYPPQTSITSASLQYATGIVALTISTKVHFYDFFYQRQLEALDTYKTILKVLLRKNILIVVSEDRILIYNVHKKQNESFIQTFNGHLVFFDSNYINLSIFYPEDQSVIVSKPIWGLKSWKNSNGVKYEHGCYFDQGSKVVLTLYNTLSFYEEGQMAKIYGFDHKILNVQSSENPNLVFALLQNGDIFAQNLKQQFRFDFEEVKQNSLISIELNEKSKKQNSYSHFWISNNWIYLWKKSENQTGKLFKAHLSKPIRNTSVESSSSSKVTVSFEEKSLSS